MKILLRILNGIGEVTPTELNKSNPLCEMGFLFLSHGFSVNKSRGKSYWYFIDIGNDDF